MNPFVQWLLSPLSEWHIASLRHKLLVGASGAATFWYLHKYKKEWPVWKQALISLGVAYGASVLLHSVRHSALAAQAPPLQLMPGPAPMMAPTTPLVVPDAQPAILTMEAPATPKPDYADEGLSGDHGIFG